MRPLANRIVRPLLFATRRRIADYRELHNVRFREDKSNSETKYTRNKIRHHIVPVLKEINPSVEETLNETAGRLAGINEIVAEYINGLRDRISAVKDAEIIFRINELKEYLQNSSVLFELFRPYGITGRMIKDLIKVLNGKTGGQIYTHSHRLLKNRGELIIAQPEKMPPGYYEINKITDFLDIPFIVSAEIVEVDPGLKIPDDPCIAFLDFDKVRFPMLIRSWQTGDYFFPLGMEKKKKLSNYFIDLKYPLTRKEHTLILESGEDIVWVIGERIDNRFRITGSTSKSLRIEAVER
jgi:tRNA(Ile)-lysidine synthase